MNQHT
jgi:hypothetical protein